ncbi:discoidin domain-containing protein [Cohnella soli]|uniref:Discoidin domain-containing protein n=2 Tax=Cohnella soli TaxID=425005 RepID=A0ABW0HSD0_9BACL
MKRISTGLRGIIIALAHLVAFPTNVFAAVTGTTSAGWNVYDPSTGGAYRYGPSMILNADNSIDMWTCSPGASGAWDYIRYKHSPDNGATWGAESIALQPTPGARDAYSVCDPGVVKFGGYYFMGYTSTENSNGTDNDVYVARATSAAGPWAKWNGSGWGGANPQPFIAFDDPNIDTYGAGEPSFVVKDSTLYIYYTWWSRDPATGKPINQTRVRTASTSNPNWPGSTTYQGVAINRDIDGDDSTDHKYVPSMNKFIAIGTARRFSPFAYIKLYESTDGISYKPATLPKSFINVAAHNAGITGNELGQFDTTKSNRIAYAYGTKWAYWYTAMNPIMLTDSNLPAVPIVKAAIAGNGQATLHFRTSGVAGETYNVKYGTSSGSYTTTLSGITSSPYTVTGLTNGTAYYFTVVATNAAGDSGNSPQVSVMPLNLTASPRAGVSASSQLSGWEASKAVDADVNTTWSSIGHTDSKSTEWITVDTGGNRMVKRVTLTPRQPNEFSFPGKFIIQVSTDNSTWIDADYDIRQYRIESPTQMVYDFNEPLNGRYVRIYATELGHDENQPWIYRLQLGDVKIEDIPYSVSQSSMTSGWEGYKVLDDNPDTAWSSIGHASAASTEWVAIDTGAVNSFDAIKVTPRALNGYGFPVDFKFQSSNNGTTWTDITGAAYTAYPNPGTATQTFKFDSTVNARYIRIYATKLSADQYGNYYMQIADVKPDMTPKRTASVSSSIAGWEAAKVADGQNNTYWSSNAHGSASSTEWVSIDMGSVQNWSGLRVRPRPDYCFPVNFKLQSSTDGVNWTDISGHTYVDYYNPGSTTQVFPFSGLVSARYFRLYATKLSADQFGNYYIQLGEMVADH